MPDLDQIKQGEQGARDRRLQEPEAASKEGAEARMVASPSSWIYNR